MDYNKEQVSAIQSTSLKTVVIAGPGSGKSRVIIGRVKWLISKKVKPSEMVCITYTVAAATVLQSRLDVQLGFCGTLHGFLYKMICDKSVSSRPTIIDDQQKQRLIAQVIVEQNFKGSMISVDDCLRRVKPQAVTISIESAEFVVMAFHRKMKESNLIDFDGIIREGATLAKTLKLPYKHLLVDEIQDANQRFMEVYESLPIPNKFYVGDPNQHIFGFLHGEPVDTTSIGKVYELIVNYRCPKVICEVAEKLINYNRPTTICSTKENGIIERQQLYDFGEEVRYIAGKMATCGQWSVGIVLRTNELIEQYQVALKGLAIPVAQLLPKELPVDWPLVSRMLMALENPNSDYLCAELIRYWKPKEAETVTKEAAKEMKSLNEFCLHLPEHLLAGEAVDFVLSKKPSELSKVKLMDARTKLSAGATIQDLMMVLREEPIMTNPNGVQIITYHSAKGREFETVFLPAFEQGIIPLKSETKTLAALAEARRLAFVGITRASRNLFISHCRNRTTQWDNRTNVEPSQFLKEMEL